MYVFLGIPRIELLNLFFQRGFMILHTHGLCMGILISIGHLLSLRLSYSGSKLSCAYWINVSLLWKAGH